MSEQQIIEIQTKPQGETLAKYRYCRDRCHFIMGPLGCLSGDTEYLTPNGWKRIDEYNGDPVAVWHEGEMNFEQPLEYIAGPADQDLYHFSNARAVSMMLSWNHRVLVEGAKGYEVISAKELSASKARYKLPVNFAPQTEGLGLSESEIRLCVAIKADGHYHASGKYDRCHITVRKERKKERIRDLLESNNIEWTEAVHSSRPTEVKFSFSYGCSKRYDEFWSANADELEVIIDEISYWDGLFTTNETRFFTTNKEDADFIQYAAHATGGKATITKSEQHNENWNTQYTVYIAKKGSRKSVVGLRPRDINIERVKHENQYCFTTSTGFFLARHNGRVFVTGNSAKTVESCQKILTLMCEQEPNDQGIRPSRWVAIRNTFPDLANTTIKDWLELYRDLGHYTQGGIEPPHQTIEFELEDGTIVQSELIFLALDRDDSVKKLRGMQVTGFWLNEIKELPKPIVDMCDLRHGRYPSKAAGGIDPTWHGMIGDYNAPDEDHWIYHLAEVVRPTGWTFFKQPGGLIRKGEKFEENPNAENLHNLPEGYYIRGMEGKDFEWIKVNLANEYGFVMDGKPVYPEFVDSVHTLDEEYKPDKTLPIILGIDFGRTPACALLQFIPVMGRWIAFDEFLTEDMSATSFAPELKLYLDRNYAGFKFGRGGGDPSGMNKGQATDDVAYSILRKNGINTVFPTFTNKPAVRRAAIIDPMKRLCMDGKPAFMVSPKARMLRKALMGGFCYKRIKVAGDKRYSDEPDKNEYSHIAEACEYALVAGGEGRKAITSSNANFNKPVKVQDWHVF